MVLYLKFQGLFFDGLSFRYSVILSKIAPQKRSLELGDVYVQLACEKDLWSRMGQRESRRRKKGEK